MTQGFSCAWRHRSRNLVLDNAAQQDPELASAAKDIVNSFGVRENISAVKKIPALAPLLPQS